MESTMLQRIEKLETQVRELINVVEELKVKSKHTFYYDGDEIKCPLCGHQSSLLLCDNNTNAGWNFLYRVQCNNQECGHYAISTYNMEEAIHIFKQKRSSK